jgi:hypothetical protein
MVALQYDGTNSADIRDMADAGTSGGVYSIAAEDAGGLTLASAQQSVWADLRLAVGDYCLTGGSVVPEATFAASWHVLGDA